jgi:predicted GIY-YIG superfamily endonuclease
MFFVYAISSTNRNYIYVGISNDIKRRFGQYQNGENKTTKASGLLYYFIQKILQQGLKQEKEKNT